MNGLLAQIKNPVLPGPLGGDPTTPGGTVVGGIISGVLGVFLIGGFITSLVFLITGAYHWITSGGDKANLEQARNKITHAVVGLIILASAWAIYVLVGKWLGVDFEKLPIPSVIPGAGTGP